MENKNIFYFKLKIIAVFIVSFPTVFFLFRLYSVFIINKTYFNNLDFSCLIYNLIHGIRFDLYAAGVFIMPVLLFLFIPYKKAIYSKIIIFSALFIFIILSILNYSDIQFFYHFHNHMTVEIFTSIGHIKFLFMLVLKNYFHFIVFSLIFSLILVYIINKKISSFYSNSNLWESKNVSKKSFISFLIVYIVFSFLCIRGNPNFYDRPIRVLDASYFSNKCSNSSSYAADISLNGIFTMFEAVRMINNRKIYIPQETSLANISKYLVTENEKQLDINYPFYKQRINFSMDKFNDINFVVIVLESFDKDIINKYPESVPFLNNVLKKNGVYYDNAYASGRRSLMGLSSLMLSIPYIQGMMPLNSGLETKEFLRIGNYLNKNGYHTLYIANEGKNEERISELVKYFAINEFYSKEDIPVSREYPFFEKGYDIDGLEFFYDKINNIDGKSVSFFWTTSTHLPYEQILSDDLKIYEGKNMLEQYLNRLRYADYALENFFQKASNSSWFKNTVFILVPDHRAVMSERVATRENIGEEYFASFILLYAPYILKPIESSLYCNIGDIIPTIIDLAHIKDPYSSFYTSLFDSTRKDFTFIYGEDNNIYTFAPNHRGG